MKNTKQGKFAFSFEGLLGCHTTDRCRKFGINLSLSEKPFISPALQRCVQMNAYLVFGETFHTA